MPNNQAYASPDFVAAVDRWLDGWMGRTVAVLVGLIFVGWTAHALHSDPRWKWHAGTGKLPHDIVREFMDLAYTQGRGADAYSRYFSPKAVDTAPDTIEHRNGEPIPDQVKKIIVEGFDVAVYHTIGAGRGRLAQDAVDIFQLDQSGWIIRRDRLTAPAGVQAQAQAQAAAPHTSAQQRASE